MVTADCDGRTDKLTGDRQINSMLSFASLRKKMFAVNIETIDIIFLDIANLVVKVVSDIFMAFSSFLFYYTTQEERSATHRHFQSDQ